MSRLVCLLLFLLGAGHQIVATAASDTIHVPSDTIHVPKADSGTAAFDFVALPDGVTGAESLAFDRRGQGPYAGVSDGRVLKWGGSTRGWTTFTYTVLKWGGSTRGWTTFTYSTSYAHNPSCRASPARPGDAEDVCGRPLGLQFNVRTGDLYIADAYHGLLKVGPAGGEAKVQAAKADGVVFTFVNGIDIDQSTGDVYFTDSSTSYTRRHNTQILTNRDASGRLMKYDARAKRVIVLKDALPYPNGVAVSADRTHVVVAHTGPCQLFRYWLKGPKVGTYELFADLPGYPIVLKDALPYPNGVAVSADRTHVVVAHTGPCQLFRYWLKGPKVGTYELFADLPGYPDNIRRDARGGYWVALNREKIDGADAAAGKHIVGVRLDAKGVQRGEMTADDKSITLSDIAEKDGKLWLGSVELDNVIVVDLSLLD